MSPHATRVLCVVGLLGGVVAFVFARGHLAGSQSESTAPPGARRSAAASLGSNASVIGGHPRSQFHIDHDRFLPATKPKTMAAADARFLRGTDDVFGLLLGGRARAYPIRMIAYHHVVNDEIHGIPVAVTY